jgi:hypothetical protein
VKPTRRIESGVCDSIDAGRFQRMVVIPEPFGPSSPVTSPASTSRDTRSTASREGPYHFVSWSATMTEGMASGDHRAASLRGRPAVACYLNCVVA